MQRFHAPAIVHEFAGQPIEQFWMRWWFATGADVFRSREKSLAEIRLPDAVHDNARGARAASVHEPIRQAKTVMRRVFLERMQHCGHVRLHFFPWPLPIAALENSRLTRQSALLQNERRRRVRPI